jgi:hypothetical protein
LRFLPLLLLLVACESSEEKFLRLSQERQTACLAYRRDLETGDSTLAYSRARCERLTREIEGR